MAKQFNPFHKWLGFDEAMSQPNHFELFRVKSNSEDPIGFRKQVHSQAKLMLAKLEEMSEEEIGQRKKLHIKLRRHVVKAHKTLLDDQLRAAYLKGLRQKVRAKKGSAKPLAVPPPQQGSVTQASKPPRKRPIIEKGSSDQTIKHKSAVNLASEPDIPMAIPLSKPRHQATDDSDNSANSDVNFDNLQSEEIVIRPGRVRRKKSWLIPILCILMTILCIAAISALLMNFGNRLRFQFSSTPAVNNSAPAKKPMADATIMDDATDPESDLETKPESETKPDNSP